MNEHISLGKLRAAAREMELAGDYFTVKFSPDLKAAVEDLPNFHPVARYRDMVASPGEIGVVERFKFIEDPSQPEQSWVLSA